MAAASSGLNRFYMLLGATAVCAWPALLHAIPDASLSLTTANAASPAESLRGALAWYVPGLLLAFGYVAALAWLHRGKAQGAEYGGQSLDHRQPISLRNDMSD